MKLKRAVMFLLLIIVLALISYYWPRITGESVAAVNSEYPKEPAFVLKIVDGDTIHAEVNGNEETIRLLGVNTPEKKQAYSNDATDFLSYEILGKEVYLLRDFTDKDKYDRKLRYVFLGNRLINLEILENGFATSYMLEGLKYKDKLTSAEKYARENGLGLWKKSLDKCKDCIKLPELNYEKEYFTIKNTCNFECDLNNWFVKDDANHFFYLDNLDIFQERKYDSASAVDANKKPVKTDVWNDEGDRLFIKDDEGNLVLFYEYES